MTIHKYHCSWDMARDRYNCFFHFGLYFSLLTQPQKWKFQKNEKYAWRHRDFIQVYQNHDQMLYCSWDMVSDGCNCYFHFRLFFALLPHNNPKNENWKKNEKKRLEISSFYTCVHKINSNLSSPKALSSNTWKKPENFWKSIPKKEIKVKKKSNCGKLQITQIRHLPTIFHSISKYYVW